MAKIKKMTPKVEQKEQELPFTFDDLLETLPKETIEMFKNEGVKSFEDFFRFMIKSGLDPMKVLTMDEEKLINRDFKLEDIMLDDEFYDDDEEYDDEDDEFYDDEEYDDEDFDEDDEDYEDNEGFDDEDYLYGFTLPKAKFIGKSKREFHIRIKLNNAPVPIWRELVVPSNITLEMLAYVILDAMGWQHEHLYQFIGKHDVYYINSHEMKEQADSFMGFMSPVQYKNSEKTTLEMVLQPKGDRMKFEYDYGDSWVHDLWVKGSRDYAPGEEPVIKLLKAAGECPPEDCGGVLGYADLLETNKKKRKTAEDKERLEWYDIPKGFKPEDCNLEWLQEDVEALWLDIKDEMEESK